jgi:hypothetical protein
MNLITKILVSLFIFVTLFGHSQKVKLPSDQFVFNIDKVSPKSYDFDLKLNEITFTQSNINNNYYSNIDIPGFFPNNKIGYPDLNRFNKLLELPYDVQFDLNIISRQSIVIDLDSLGISLISPSQRSISKGEDPTKVPFQINKEVYNKDEFIKYDLLKIVKTGILRKHQISRLEICPFEYNPIKNHLIVYYDIRFEIIFKNNKSVNDNSNYNQQEFLQLISNSADLSGNSNRDYITTYPTTYVIVADRNFENEIQPFIQWKTKKGFNVIEAYTDQTNVGNSTSSIKSYLEDLYINPINANPPSYILLVGDVADIPSFSGLHGAHVSDLYYAEYDGNGDTYADVYYGRFSSSDPLEIQHMVEKSIRYEKYNFQDPSFLANAVMISGVDASMAPTYGNGQINYANEYYTNSSNGINTHTYLYPESGTSSSDILQKINEGCSFANYTAHGYGQGWADPAFTCTDVHSMTNVGKPAMMIGNCCQSNKFDEPECFGEALLRVENKGAIGYIGGSNNTYWNEDYWWAVGAGSISANPVYDPNTLGFYDKLFHNNNESQQDWYTTNAQIMMGGNLAVTQAGGADDYYCEIYHLIGDPSIMTYFGEPTILNVLHDEVVPLGISSVAINTEEGAYVAISQNGIYIDAGLVSNNGILDLDISAITSLDSIDVVVTKQNKIPYFGSISIISPNGVFLLNSNNQFIDVSGNLNNEIDFNEIVDVHSTIKNYGNETANGVYALLNTSSNNISILQDSSNWGTLSADFGLENQQAFKFEVDGFVTDQQIIPFQLEIFDNQNNIWNSYFQIQVNAPNTIANDIVIDDNQLGNNNNRIDPGENLNLLIPTTNNGHSDHIQLLGTLSCNSDLIEIVSPSFDLETLAIGEQQEALFNITVDSSFIPGNMVSFTYSLNDGDYQNEFEFEFTVGLLVEDFNNGDISTTGWTNNSLFPWLIDSLEYFNNNFSLRSTNANADESESVLSLDLNVSSVSQISFMKKVSSESGYDYLKFLIDDIELETWSGEVDWSFSVYDVEAGNHNFKWVYSKDFSVSDGLDAAWIDEVVFPIIEGTNVNVPLIDNTQLLLYPNPVKSDLFIYSKNISIETINLFDLYGRLLKPNILFNKKSNDFIIKTDEISTGTYLLQFKTSFGFITKRVIVKR